MGCRVGMTTNIEDRKLLWQTMYSTLKNWEILGGPMSKEDAQVMETREALERGCDAHQGGRDPDDPLVTQWYVYYFEY